MNKIKSYFFWKKFKKIRNSKEHNLRKQIRILTRMNKIQDRIIQRQEAIIKIKDAMIAKNSGFYDVQIKLNEEFAEHGWSVTYE